MACFKLADGRLQETTYPCENDDYERGLSEAGYFAQLGSKTHNAHAGEVTLYTTDQPGKPPYLLSIWGFGHEIASLVADDFPALVMTMKEIGPLLTLTGLDQQASIQAEAIEAREH